MTKFLCSTSILKFSFSFSFSVYMAIHGITWVYMGIHGNTWHYMGIHGYTWVYMAIHGYTWLFWYISWYTLITLLKVPTFSSDRRLKFIFCVKCRWNILCLCVAQLKLWFQTDLGRENSVSCYRQGRQLLLTFSPCSRVGHALRPIFMLWLVKIWQVSSCGKFRQHLESCLLWPLKLTEFCVNLWFF